MNIEFHWALQFAMIVQCCHLSIAPAYLCSKFSRPNHSYGIRGHRSSLRPLRALSVELSPFQIEPLLWNSLPALLQSANSHFKFKASFLVNCSSHSFMNSTMPLMFGSPHPTVYLRGGLCVGSRGAVVSAALSERKVAGSIPTIGDFHTVGPCKKAVFACLATDVK